MISKDDIKQHLFNALKDGRFLWSYDNAKMRADDLSDEFLIELVLLHLDLEDLNLLFSIYPKKQIKEVWKWKMCALEPRYHSSNVFFAKIYFDIKNADLYIKKQSQRAIKTNLGYGWDITKN